MLGHCDELHWCYWEPWVGLCHITGVTESIWTDYTGVIERTGVDCAITGVTGSHRLGLLV